MFGIFDELEEFYFPALRRSVSLMYYILLASFISQAFSSFFPFPVQLAFVFGNCEKNPVIPEKPKDFETTAS